MDDLLRQRQSDCKGRLSDIQKLVGGLEDFLFFNMLGIIIPIDQYFSVGLKPPTRKGHWGSTVLVSLLQVDMETEGMLLDSEQLGL